MALIAANMALSTVALRTASLGARALRAPRWPASPSPISSSAYRHRALRMASTAPEKAEEGTVQLPTNESSDRLLRIRHSSAHVMAMAVQRLYPEAQVTIGPWIEKGFYYDFHFADGTAIADEDLKKIKKEMDRIGREKLPFTREEVSREEARKRIEAQNEPFKLEILDSIKTEPITIYHIGDEWWDLCAGPHVDHTGQLPAKAIALESVAGAYWRGDESRPMLSRIYGTAWESKDQLKEHKRLMEEAKKRDHRVLGKKLDLFSIQEEAGGGLVLWHPKGALVRNKLETFWKDVHIDYDYDLLYTPHIANLELWKTSGHFGFYREGMFDQMEVEDEQYQIKPMNCPFHVLTYKSDMRSYRDLPVRYAELGTVYRYERSGTLHGLMRVRGFTQDDGHIFCLPEQVTDEIVSTLDLTEDILSRFGFTDYDIMLSTRPEKSVGDDAVWDLATNALRDALDRKGWSYEVDEGGGAFYGPKIDVKIRDAIGRTWQCSTVQADFQLPERFDLEYVTPEGGRERPIMIHRAIFGSIERFFGVLIESTAGDLPLWLAPEQLRLAPVTDDAKDYAKELTKSGKKEGLRITLPRGSERLGKQVRNAEMDRVPLVGVIGAKEVETQTITLRARGVGDLGTFAASDVIAAIKAADDKACEITETLPEPIKAKEE